MEMEAVNSEYLDPLESSGIIDAYEYVLRKLIEENLPKAQVYEKCARYLLEYQQLLLAKNIRAKNAQKFFELIDEEKQEKQVKAKEIIPTFPITLKSRLLLEQEQNKPTRKIFETNIDELIKNKLNLLSKENMKDNYRSNLSEYGSYSAFVQNENERLRNYNFKLTPNFTTYQFITLEEIEKNNYDLNNINNNANNNNVNNNNINNNVNINNEYLNSGNNYNNANQNLNSDTEFIIPNDNESKKTLSRKGTNKSKKTKSSKSETETSKSVTPSEASRIKKVSKSVVDDLMKKK